MARFIALRLLGAVPVLFLVTVFVFVLVRLSPGDPAAAMAGPAATNADIEAIRLQLGLDRPLITQFIAWLGQLAHGDLGRSIQANEPVASLIAQRMWPTLALAACTIMASVLIAVPLGMAAAWRQGSPLDRGIMAFSVLGFSVPTFVLAYVWIYIFSMETRLLPVQGYRSLAEGIGAFARHMALPTLTLSSVFIALITRMTRAAVLDVMTEDYIRTARAKGMGERRVLLRHALRNAAAPIITVIGLSIAMLIGGVVVTESVFNFPGLGRLTVDAVLARDYTTIQALILVFSMSAVLINLAVDLLYGLLDPRVGQ